MSWILTCAIVLAALAGVMLRPRGVHEAVPAMAGAMLLVLCGLLPPMAALRAAWQGWDVYLFLAGMMILAELAALEGVFAWAAVWVARAAGGSAWRLFGLVYALAVIITAFLSNDATAVVFTPAVAAMARAAGVPERMPYLLVCAFVANAASFVLPISNPANLVVFGAAMPDLVHWLGLFWLPSVAAIGLTFLVLAATQAAGMRQGLAVPHALGLSRGGRLTLAGLGVMAGVMLLASACGWRLGPPAFAAGAGTACVVLGLARGSPMPVLRAVAWDVLVLVAGLFVMLGALDRLGLAAILAAPAARLGPYKLGAALGLLSNAVNNLPAGLLAGHVLAGAAVPMRAAALIGVDVGPNLAITGSLASILWLAALRRAGEEMNGWRFLRLGLVVMPPALVAALYGLRLAG